MCWYAFCVGCGHCSLTSYGISRATADKANDIMVPLPIKLLGCRAHYGLHKKGLAYYIGSKRDVHNVYKHT